MKEIIYQPRAQCENCRRIYEIEQINVEQTCPHCLIPLKLLPEHLWRVKVPSRS